jgi:hypothetical protein
VLVWDGRPLTDDVRSELVAANLLERLVPQSRSKEELDRLIREHPAIDENVRQRALDMTR